MAAAPLALAADPPAPPAPGTRGDHRPAAEICRERGWGPGTRLDGATKWEVTTIEITAIGERIVLAKMIAQDGHALGYDTERPWVLFHRDWREVGR